MITSQDGQPIAFHDLTPDHFPFRLRFIDMDSDELLDEIVAHGPGAIKVPGWAPRRVKCEITFCNGMQYVEGPGISEARQLIPPPRIG